jgi:hypothetical protein
MPIEALRRSRQGARGETGAQCGAIQVAQFDDAHLQTRQQQAGNHAGRKELRD